MWKVLADSQAWADALPVLILIAVLLVAAAAAVRPLWRLFRRLDQHAKVPEQLATLQTEVGNIRAELHPNSTHSLRDAVDRIETRTIRLEQRLDVIERRP